MLNISVGGDAAGGYLVDVHDGAKHAVYRPEGVSDDAGAFAAAVKEHGGELAQKLAAAFAPATDHD